MAFALIGARVFDGAHIIEDAAVVVDGGRVVSLTAAGDLPAGLEKRPVAGLIAPGA